ncbi:sigma 54-interacting transcriptional regulator [Selenomonas sp. TAMA-11512]|uniref:sigma 54-interacting transcriptional regulator n=1 Tax=Selenomonas sp. TAMA-11512 TaxID=3095337 RepID=UPI00308C2907|nr:sigma 54-interacting transcriptional regulator [Selenomonas sp. TAMA-11512]
MSKQTDRRQRILSFIETHMPPDGYDASYIAEFLGLDRANTSRELNALSRDGLLVRIAGRPVRFRIETHPAAALNTLSAEEPPDAEPGTDPEEQALPAAESMLEASEAPLSIFSRMIGYDQSLKMPIQQAKAAVLYPPHGLHTLIVGATGGGKTTLAKVMYLYAKEMHRLDSDAPYVIFNCADYAKNPQLLLSHLFGHKKGAFTGANEEREGIVEKADGGILFLDEIHRLPPEGQEMLFSLIDRGEYYRLGDTEHIRSADILILAATTEQPNTAILKTLLRRIPNVIKMPDLKERSLEERYYLIKSFFQKEAKNMALSFSVSAEIIKFFMSYDCPGNIGQLENDIKLVCANAFVNYIVGNERDLFIGLSHLPPPYLADFDMLTEGRGLLDSFFYDGRAEDLFFSPDQPLSPPLNESEDLNIYQLMENHSKKYFADGLSQKTIKKIFNNQIVEQFQYVSSKSGKRPVGADESAFLKIISADIYEPMKAAISTLKEDFDVTLPPQVFHGLVLHVETMVERVRRGRAIPVPESSDAELFDNKYYQAAQYLVRVLEDHLNLTLPVQEAIFISLYLQTLDLTVNDKHVGILLLSHGYHAAVDMAVVANRLLDVDHAHGLCMPLEEKVSQALARATQFVQKIDEGKGVLILADMGSLHTFGGLITKATGIKTHTIRMVNLPLAIEATRKALLPAMTLENLVEELDKETCIAASHEEITQKKDLLYSSKRIFRLVEGTLIFLDSKKAIPLLEKIFLGILSDLGIEQTPNLYIKFIFHTACMLERAIRNDPLVYENLQELQMTHRSLYQTIASAFDVAERTYGIEISEGELCYITEIFAYEMARASQ